MPSAFLGVYTAIYGYAPQSDQELALQEGDVLYVLEKSSEDDWWKAKKRGNSADDDEPVGLVPTNYIEEAKPIGKYQALYDYTQQTEEEISFSEETILDVYDASDPDWALVGLNGEYGFAPANYIKKIDSLGGASTATARETPVEPIVESTHTVVLSPRHVSFEPAESSPLSAASPVAQHFPASQTNVYQHPPTALPTHRSSLGPNSPRSPPSGLTSPSLSSNPHSPSFQSSDRRKNHDKNRRSTTHSFVSDSDSDGPSLPIRRPGEPRYGAKDNSSHPIPPGFRTYAVQEVDSKKKRAATLGLGPSRIILVPDKSSRPGGDWTSDRLKEYNYEGKHVFLELEKPTRSLDLHAGSTDVAEEIISALADMMAARKATGLEEVIAAATSGKKSNIGTVLYDFPAQGEDEVSVTIGDEVVILDDSSGEWWLVRRQVNGVEGVVPSSYIERGRSKVVSPGNMPSGIMESPGDPNERAKLQQSQSVVSHDTGPSGVPRRSSSLHPQNRKSAPAKSKPDSSQIRTWTDRTASFKVEAQFLGYRDGKIHLHKLNGVKIAVPVSKMSLKDIEYVEAKAGISLDEEKPLKAIQERQRSPRPNVGIIVEQPSDRNKPSGTAVGAHPHPFPRKDDYDWFEFFLSCGVDVSDCQRYATNFHKDNMDEKLLESITAENMRTLGLKEGDILRVAKKLDEKFNRKQKIAGFADDEDTSQGQTGRFSGPIGELKNNTGRARPKAAMQTSDVVDPKAFVQGDPTRSPPAATPASKSPPPAANSHDASRPGFDDDAWAPKPAKTQSSSPEAPRPVVSPTTTAPPAQPAENKPAATGSMLELLSLSDPPLQPTIISPTPAPQISAPLSSQATSTPTSSAPASIPPFAQLPPQLGLGLPSANSVPSASPAMATPTGYGGSAGLMNTTLNQFTGRQRPSVPVISNGSGGPLNLPPPPGRPISAPQYPNIGPPAQFQVPSLTGMQQLPSFMNYQPPQQPPPSSMQTQGPILSQPTGAGFGGYGGAYTGLPNMPGQFPMGNGQLGNTNTLPYINVQQQQTQPSMPLPEPQPPQSFNSSINSTLPPPLAPKPLVPQPTGPAPSIRFGLPAQKKLAPQPTGRANLSKATPENPFGF